MGFDPTLVEMSHSPDDIGLLPFRAESDIGTDSHTDVCCHHSDAVESRSPCTQCGLTAGPRTEGEVGRGKGRKAWTSGSGVEWIKTCVNILQLNR